MSSHYKDDFYVDLHDKTLYPANTILDIVLDSIPRIESAVDVGCAVGSWLAALKARGVEDIIGLDGDWVNEDLLEIPRDKFRKQELDKPFALEKKYDLAMSLEVAEHLPESSAAGFVKSLTESSDFVLFSAAVPYQGGTYHINEQWLDYWYDLFFENDFLGIDIVRKKIWRDENIPFWYKQNMILYVKKERMSELILNERDSVLTRPISLVHPEQYLSAKVASRIVLDEIKKRFKIKK